MLICCVDGLTGFPEAIEAVYLRDRDLQREINEGLNLIESWNRVNDVIFFAKSGEFATNRRDQQQLGMLALHILQAALVYVNTLMIQDILDEPEWHDVVTADDKRGLTALFWAHVRPYGEITLNMTKRWLSAPATRPSSTARALEHARGHRRPPDLTPLVGWCHVP